MGKTTSAREGALLRELEAETRRREAAERYAAEVHRTHALRPRRCLWCGAVLPICDDGERCSPDRHPDCARVAEVHLATCPKHPMGALRLRMEVAEIARDNWKAEARRLERRIKAAQSALTDTATPGGRWKGHRMDCATRTSRLRDCDCGKEKTQ